MLLAWHGSVPKARIGQHRRAHGAAVERGNGRLAPHPDEQQARVQQSSVDRDPLLESQLFILRRSCVHYIIPVTLHHVFRHSIQVVRLAYWKILWLEWLRN